MVLFPWFDVVRVHECFCWGSCFGFYMNSSRLLVTTIGAILRWAFTRHELRSSPMFSWVLIFVFMFSNVFISLILMDAGPIWVSFWALWPYFLSSISRLVVQITTWLVFWVCSLRGFKPWMYITIGVLDVGLCTLYGFF